MFKVTKKTAFSQQSRTDDIESYDAFTGDGNIDCDIGVDDVEGVVRLISSAIKF